MYLLFQMVLIGPIIQVPPSKSPIFPSGAYKDPCTQEIFICKIKFLGTIIVKYSALISAKIFILKVSQTSKTFLFFIMETPKNLYLLFYFVIQYNLYSISYTGKFQVGKPLHPLPFCRVIIKKSTKKAKSKEKE